VAAAAEGKKEKKIERKKAEKEKQRQVVQEEARSKQEVEEVSKACEEEKQRRKQHEYRRQKQEQAQRKQEIEREQTMIKETGGWEEVHRKKAAKSTGGGQALEAATAAGVLLLEAAAVKRPAPVSHSTRGVVGVGGNAWSRMQSGVEQQGVVGVNYAEVGVAVIWLRAAESIFEVDEPLRPKHIGDERNCELEHEQTLQHEAEEGAKQAERKDEARRLKKINANKKNWQKNHEAAEWKAAQEQAEQERVLQAEVALSSSGEAAINMGATTRTWVLPSNVEWNPVLELAAQGGAAVDKRPTIAEVEKRHKAEMDALTLHFQSEKQMNQECIVCLDDIKCMALAPCSHTALCR